MTQEYQPIVPDDDDEPLDLLTEPELFAELALMTAEQVEAYMRHRVQRSHRKRAELVRLHGWCTTKFGDAPALDLPPRLPGPVPDRCSGAGPVSFRGARDHE